LTRDESGGDRRRRISNRSPLWAWKDLELAGSQGRGWVVNYFLLLLIATRGVGGTAREGVADYTKRADGAEAITYFDSAIAADTKKKEAWTLAPRREAYAGNQERSASLSQLRDSRPLRLDTATPRDSSRWPPSYLWERSPERAIRRGILGAIVCDP